MKDEFLANVSHELRTPLNAVMGLSALIEVESDHEKIKNYAHNIHLSGRHLLDIVNELLDFSKIQAGKFQIEKTRLPLIKVFKDCHAILLALAKEKCVNLRFDYQDIAEDLYVEGDEIRLNKSSTISCPMRSSLQKAVSLRLLPIIAMVSSLSSLKITVSAWM